MLVKKCSTPHLGREKRLLAGLHPGLGAETNKAFLWAKEAGDDFKCGGFAAAGGSEEAGDSRGREWKTEGESAQGIAGVRH